MSRHLKDEKVNNKKISNNRKTVAINKVIRFLVFINLLLILILKLFSKGVTHTATPTIWFYILLVINVFIILLLGNKKFFKGKLLFFTIFVYLILILCLPAYKLNGQESVIDDSKTNYKNFAGVDYIITYENVVDYTDYYNLYGLHLKRNVKN